MGTQMKDENEDVNEKQAKLSAESKDGESNYRTTVMFSATMAPEVEKLAKKYLRCPVIVSIGGSDSYMNMRIKQIIKMTSEKEKPRELIQILRQCKAPIILFVNKKITADSVYKQIRETKYRAVALHSGKSQMQRSEAFIDFKNGKYDILIATDVAGRGLDIEGVDFVINYDCPQDIDKYSHRIGRTGRAGRNGTAFTILTKEDEGMYYDLVKYLKATKQDIPKELEDHPRAKVPPGSDQGRDHMDSVVYAYNYIFIFIIFLVIQINSLVFSFLFAFIYVLGIINI